MLDDIVFLAAGLALILNGGEMFVAAAVPIAEFARVMQADLLVVATQGRTGLARALMGSVAGQVVRLAPCPVLVIRAQGAQSAKSE